MPSPFRIAYPIPQQGLPLITESAHGTAVLPLPSRTRVYPSSATQCVAEVGNIRLRLGRGWGSGGNEPSIDCNPTPHPSPFGRGSRPCSRLSHASRKGGLTYAVSERPRASLMIGGIGRIGGSFTSRPASLSASTNPLKGDSRRYWSASSATVLRDPWSVA